VRREVAATTAALVSQEDWLGRQSRTPTLHRVSFSVSSRNRLFGSTSITGQAIVSQAEGWARCVAPSQSLDVHISGAARSCDGMARRPCFICGPRKPADDGSDGAGDWPTPCKRQGVTASRVSALQGGPGRETRGEATSWSRAERLLVAYLRGQCSPRARHEPRRQDGDPGTSLRIAFCRPVVTY
jgi:hypothetical protein